MKYEILYHEGVIKKDIPKLSKKERIIIQSSIEKKLGTKPEIFGKPLRKSLRNYRKLRVGNYRVVFRIEKKKIKIFAIVHRRTVYDKAGKRIV